MKSMKKRQDDEKIHRFSNIQKDTQVPYYKYYNPKPDPVPKLDNRKTKTTEYPIKKPKLHNMKCFKCKEKKIKDIVVEQRTSEEFTVPLSAKLLKECEERRKKEKNKFFICRKEVIRLPSPIDTAVAHSKHQLEYSSAIKDQHQKIVPEKISLPDKWPEDPLYEEIMAKIPKSGLFINQKAQPKPTVDSNYFIYDEQYRKDHPWYEMYRGSDAISIEPFNPFILDDLDVVTDDALFDMNDAECEDDDDEDNDIENELAKLEEDELKITEKLQTDVNVKGQYILGKLKAADYTDRLDKNILTRQQSDESDNFNDAISEVSAATSIVSDMRLSPPTPEQLEFSGLVPPVMDRILQKYQDSDAKLAPPSADIKRGTIMSHSASTLGKLPEKFFFGVKLGTMHYGDVTFSEKSRFRQGLPMCVTAYIYSFIKAPNKWNCQDINKVLDMGDKLYLKSLNILHLHDNPRILNPEDLHDTFEFCNKKIKYKIDDPDIAGFTRSEDPKVYSLTKGLNLFFSRNRSGILQTYNTNILIWKQKHFFVFDPEPRNEELYSSDDGNSIIANLYDIPSIGSMLLNRGKLENWPFIISKITIKNVQTDQNGDEGDSITTEFREESLYQIINPNKATINGSLSISDNCFGEFKNKQPFAISTIALMYNDVTPACSWHNRTVDKIMRVANQFFIECLRDTGQNELKIENLPAFFTIGPLMIEIAIVGNLYAGLMYRKTHCLFDELIRKFFLSNTKAIVEIDNFAVAIWRNRDVFYMFDPYSRNKDGLHVKNGTACVTMNTNIDTMIETVLLNFTDRHFIFKLHALKMIRITRDAEFGRYPKNFQDSEECFFDAVKIADKRDFVPKNITVDKTEYAVKIAEIDHVVDPSLRDVGSFVGSLDRKFVPGIEACTPRILAKALETTKQPEKVIDLDSPTLSETHFERAQAPLNREDSYEFKLIQELYDEERMFDNMLEEAEDEELDYLKLLTDDSLIDLNRQPKDVQLTSGFDEDSNIKMAETGPIQEKMSTKVNTDLLGLVVMPREILEPNQPPQTDKKPRIKTQQRIPDTPEITQITELAKISNYISLPDGSEILYGTKNIAHLTYDYDAAIPFISAVAIVMESKYTLTTWTRDVVDAILDYGNALFNTLEVKFSDVPTIVVPRLTIGHDSYHVTINFLFDSLLALSILEQCLQKLIFRELESAMIVTSNYSCAVFLKRKLYYMYDGFGCNLVGLGEGPDNTGVACMFRFKSLHPLVKRFLYNKKKRELEEPTEASRFIISTVEIKPVFPPPPEMIPRREKQLPRIKGDVPRPYFESNPMKVSNEKRKSDTTPTTPDARSRNKVGYHQKGIYHVIEGSSVLLNRSEGQGEVKACHFIGVCAMIGIFGKPIKTWDTKRVDYVLEIGNKLYGYVDKLNFADKRNITNLLFDKHFYDVIVKRVMIADDRKVRNFKAALQQLLLRNKYLLIQFPNCCFVLYRGKKLLHLFDPYGLGETPKSCWIKFEDLKKMINYIHQCQKNFHPFYFYTINISKFKKATRKQKLDYKLRASYVKKKKEPKPSNIGYEDEDWLLVYPLPWSRMKKELACGKTRGTKSHVWHDWDVEYPEDVYSLVSTTHQTSSEFPKKYRGKQTIANCIVAIIMTEIYNFIDWNTNIMDAILKDGNQYFVDCFKNITKSNYEIHVEDFLKTVLVFPYSFKIDLFPLFEGTMYIIKKDQFNISKALQYFFEAYENRCGIICCTNGTRTKYIAFGRVRNCEYFMYDCSATGPPMFLDQKMSKAYVLRCLTLNRLIHIVTVTLRSGDFFIYHVGISEEQEEEVMQQVVYYDDEPAKEINEEPTKEQEEIDEKVWNDKAEENEG